MEQETGKSNQNDPTKDEQKTSTGVVINYLIDTIKNAFTPKNKSNSTTKEDGGSNDALLKQQIVEQQNANAIAGQQLSETKKANSILGWYTFFTAIIMAGTIGAFIITYRSNEEIRKEFKSQHQCVLQVSNVDTINKRTENIFDIKYIINNLGTEPAKVKSGKFFILTMDTAMNKNLEMYLRDDVKAFKQMFTKNWNADSSIFNAYIIKEQPLNWTFKQEIDTSSKMMVGYPRNSVFFFCGDIFYTNQITEDEKEYMFVVKLDFAEKNKTVLFVNENMLIKK